MKEFFTSKRFKLMAWIMLVISVIALLICGTSTENINKGVLLAIEVQTALQTLICFIIEMVNQLHKEDEED